MNLGRLDVGQRFQVTALSYLRGRVRRVSEGSVTVEWDSGDLVTLPDGTTFTRPRRDTISRGTEVTRLEEQYDVP